MIRRIQRATKQRLRFWRDGLRAVVGGFRVSEQALRKALNVSVDAVEGDGQIFCSDERAAVAERFRADYPAVAEVVIRAAERACAREFDLLGSGPVRMTEGIRWHEDFAVGRAWPRRFSALLPVQYKDESDIKRVWELSRCQHFAVLGIAHWIDNDIRHRDHREHRGQLRQRGADHTKTERSRRREDRGRETNSSDNGIGHRDHREHRGRETDSEGTEGEAAGPVRTFSAPSVSSVADSPYAREWVEQMLDWDRANPPLVGPNWMVTMEASIRIVNWIWGYFFMGDSPAFTPSAASVFYRNLLSHGRFIMRHLEDYGNHRFSNFVGLVFLGVLFPEFKEAAQWRETGLRGFSEEVTKQVRADGCHFEGSIPYHRLVLEMAATTWLLCRRNGIALPRATTDAIGRMFDFTARYLKPSGLAPQIGDADDGRLQELTPLDKRDHSYLLSLGAVLTGNGELKISDWPHPEAFWLLGEEGFKAYAELPTAARKDTSVGFEESGFYILRSKRLHVFVSCRRPHANDIGAHSHNDHLTFTLSVDGLDFIVDAGTCTYTGDLAERHDFRSSLAHNTVVVDAQEINALRKSDPFRLKDKAGCRVAEWRRDEERDVLIAEHDGYARMGVRVRREFRLDRREEVLSLRDRVSGERRHGLEWRFLFAPEVEVRLDEERITASRDGATLLLRFDGREELKARVEHGWYSPSYGVRRETSRLVVAGACELPVDMAFVVEPAWTVSRTDAVTADRVGSP